MNNGKTAMMRFLHRGGLLLFTSRCLVEHVSIECETRRCRKLPCINTFKFRLKNWYQDFILHDLDTSFNFAKYLSKSRCSSSSAVLRYRPVLPMSVILYLYALEQPWRTGSRFWLCVSVVW